MQTCNTYGLLTHCEHCNDFLKPLTGKNRTLSIERLTTDVFSGRFIPKDVPLKLNLIAVKTANDDCMFGSGSVFACCKDDGDFVFELRLRVIIALVLYTDNYLESNFR